MPQQMHGRRGEVGLVAQQHHVLHRRPPTRHLDDLWRQAKAALDLLDEPGRRRAEGQGQPRTAGRHVADEAPSLGADLPEEHGPGIAVESGGDVREVDRPFLDLELAGLAQPCRGRSSAENGRDPCSLS